MKLTCFRHIDFKIISCHLSMILFLTGCVSDVMQFSLAMVRGSRHFDDEFVLERIRSTLPE